MYFHSLSLPANVLAPHTSVPLPVKERMALMDFPATGSILRSPCASSVIIIDGPVTPVTCTLAGAFHTPLDESTAAYIPAMAPLGGM